MPRLVGDAPHCEYYLRCPITRADFCWRYYQQCGIRLFIQCKRSVEDTIRELDLEPEAVEKVRERMHKNPEYRASLGTGEHKFEEFFRAEAIFYLDEE